jgi:hypothetical protein
VFATLVVGIAGFQAVVAPGAYASTPKCAPGNATIHGESSGGPLLTYVTVPGTSVKAEAMAIDNILYAGDDIYAGAAMLVMQTDGNLVDYGYLPQDVGCGADWSSGTYHKPVATSPYSRLSLEDNGNMYLVSSIGLSYVLYNCSSQTYTICSPLTERLAVQNDGNIVLYNTGYTPWHVEWATNTCSHCLAAGNA